MSTYSITILPVIDTAFVVIVALIIIIVLANITSCFYVTFCQCIS